MVGHAKKGSVIFLFLAVYYVFITTRIHQSFNGNVSTKAPYESGSDGLQFHRYSTNYRLQHRFSPARKKKFLVSRIGYYSNSDACYQIQRIRISGDISPNPGPNIPDNNSKNKCSICSRTIAKNHRAIICNNCKLWYHIKCGGVLAKDYKKLQTRERKTWICSNCLWKELPFNSTNSESGLDESLSQDEDTSLLVNESFHCSDPNLFIQRKRDSRNVLVAHLNINSIQNKIEELKELNEMLKAQVIFLSETKIDSTYPDEQFAIDGYKQYRKDRTKGGGGVMAYVSHDLTSKKVGLPKVFKTIECLTIETVIAGKDTLIIGIYRPPKPAGEEYYKKLEDELNGLFMWAVMLKQFVIVVGDLNLDRLRPDKREGKLLVDMEEIHSFTCLIDKPTRVTPTSQTLIDVLLTSNPDAFMSSGIVNPGLSDHALIYGVMNMKVKHYPHRILATRNYATLDVKSFKEDLEKAPWHVMEIFDSIDDKYDYWSGLLNYVMDEYVPIKKKRVRSKDVPYMTKKWKDAIRSKRRAAKSFAKERTPENLELKRKTRNEATKERRKAIRNYWEKKTKEMHSKPRDFFKAFKPFLGTKKVSSGSDIIQIKMNDGIERDQKVVAEEFSKYFATLADDIGGRNILSLSEEDFNNHPSIVNITNNWNYAEQFSFSKITNAETIKALESLNPTKSMGWDQIPPKLLKLVSNELAPSLTNIFNVSINSGIYPRSWKKGEWVPVHKKDDKTNKKNYRPVTVLNAVNKIFEQRLCNQVTEKVDSHLSVCMSAYRKRHSCETTLLKLVEDWKSAVDSGEIAGVISTDTSKAFDSLLPSLMMRKLKAYNFSEDALALLRSYFEQRQGRVKLGNTMSSWQDIQKGCPQGSCFGPLLWNIFQNDLSFSIKKCHLSMYADDHQLYTSASQPSEVGRTLNDQAQIAADWYTDNFLLTNKEKFQAMVISNANRVKDISEVKLKVDNEEIEQITSFKLLGVYIDNRLTFSEHIKSICIKSSQKIGVIMRLKNLIPEKAKLHLFKTAILPHLTYCSLTWHFIRASDKRKLERVQEKGLRAVFKDSSFQSSYEDLLRKAKLPTLYNRRLQDLAILMFKVKHGLCPTYISDLFMKHNSYYNLRNSDFSIPRFNSVTYGKHSIRYLGPFLWGRLTRDLREKPNLKIFKKEIRMMDLSSLISNDCGANCSLCSS